MCTVIMNTIHYHMERIEMEENVLKMLYVVVKCHIFKSYLKKKKAKFLYVEKFNAIFLQRDSYNIYSTTYTQVL